MSPRVLVLDNDSALGELLALAFQRGGLEPEVCRSSAEAEQALRGARADFLVLDLNLGGGDSGEQLAHRWSLEGLLPPFLMLTGTPLDPRLEQVRGLAQFRGVIAKPFSLLELAERIRAEAARPESLEEGA